MSLFSFLDVLVCTMGALILLLIVTIWRIREQVQERYAAAQVASATSLSLPDTRFDEIDDSPLLPLLTIEAPPVPPRPVVVAQPLPPPPPPKPRPPDPRPAQLAARRQEQAQLDREWQDRIEQLSRDQSRVVSSARSLEADVGQRRALLADLSVQIASLEATLHDTEQQRQGARAQLQSLSAQRAATKSQIDALEAELVQVRQKQATRASSEFTFVPFDPVSGTTRRPVILDCRADRIDFTCEHISLTPAQLDGYVPSFNPLAAGVAALLDVYGHRRSSEDPYVLLLVRPEGTVSFYIARMYLSALHLEFGYELVAQDQEFVFPDSDAELVTACRAAIDRALREKSRLRTDRGIGFDDEDGPVHLAGPGGTFRLEEVEKLRAPTRSVQFGGQQIDRNAHMAPPPAAVAGAQPQPERVGPLARLMGRKPGGHESSLPGGGVGAAGTPGFSDATVSSNRSPSGGMPSPGKQAAASALPEEESQASQTSPWTKTPAQQTSKSSFAEGDGVASADRNAPPPDDSNAPRPPAPRADDWPPPAARRAGPPSFSSFGSGITFQRDIKVRVTATELQVGNQQPIAWPAGRVSDETTGRFSAAIEKEMRHWGAPPKGFRWQPRLSFNVSPGATPVYVQLNSMAKNWGVESTVTYGLQ